MGNKISIEQSFMQGVALERRGRLPRWKPASGVDLALISRMLWAGPS